MESSLVVPPKIKNKLKSDPSVLLLSMYPKEMKLACQRCIYTLMFTAALFIIAYIWN
jgi:hypothetical protein